MNILENIAIRQHFTRYIPPNLRNSNTGEEKIGNILMPYVVLEHHTPSQDSRHSILNGESS